MRIGLETLHIAEAEIEGEVGGLYQQTNNHQGDCHIGIEENEPKIRVCQPRTFSKLAFQKVCAGGGGGGGGSVLAFIE